MKSKGVGGWGILQVVARSDQEDILPFSQPENDIF